MDELDGIDPMDDNKLNDFETSFNPKDLLGKVLAFVNQVRALPPSSNLFQRALHEGECATVTAAEVGSVQDGASLYDLLHRLFVVRKVSGPLS